MNLPPFLDADFDAASNPILEWFKQRKQQILDSVTAADILERNGVALDKKGLRPEQISCPFHGKDNRPSARYFPADPKSASHVYCFFCKQRWDAIGLWRKFNGDQEYKAALGSIERAFGLKPPEEPKRVEKVVVPEDMKVVESLLKTCERRLKQDKLDIPIESHLKLCRIMDQQWDLFSNPPSDPSKLKTHYAVQRTQAEKILNLIGEKIRAKKATD